MRVGKEKGVSIAPELIGLFFEDINFAADGGLYAELIENRSFEAKEAYGNPGKFYAVDDFGYAWKTLYQAGEEEPLMQYVTGTPVSAVNPQYLRFTAKQAGQGFTNKAYDGIRLEKDHTYKVSFYAILWELNSVVICKRISALRTEFRRICRIFRFPATFIAAVM